MAHSDLFSDFEWKVCRWRVYARALEWQKEWSRETLFALVFSDLKNLSPPLTAITKPKRTQKKPQNNTPQRTENQKPK